MKVNIKFIKLFKRRSEGEITDDSIICYINDDVLTAIFINLYIVRLRFVKYKLRK